MKPYMKDGKEMIKVHFLAASMELASREVEQQTHHLAMNLVRAGRFDRERFFSGQPCALSLGVGWVCKYPMKRAGHREPVELA